MPKITLVFLFLWITLTSVSFAQNIDYHRGQEASTQDFPWSEAVRVNDLLFLAGKIGMDPATNKLVTGGITNETAQVLENIKATLAHNNASMADVVKCTIFLADMEEWSAMNDVYRTYFGPNFPARSALGVNKLAFDARVEIECIAAPKKHLSKSEQAKSDVYAVIKLYTEGTFEGDEAKLRKSFHSKAVMNGYLPNQLLMATPAPFIESITKAPIKDTGVPYQYEIKDINVDGKVASATLSETGFPGGLSFTNFFHLIDDGTGWKIVSKAFYSHVKK